MKNERNIDFRAGTTYHRIRQRQAKKTLQFPIFQRGLGGFSSAFHILDRGYCGHEHLLDHAIINMNGRIYDPVVGQFMQADNYIQTPEDYIGYNRYAYCRYNPFKYTDPSGEQWLESGYKTDSGARIANDEVSIESVIAGAMVLFRESVQRGMDAMDAVNKRMKQIWADEAAAAASDAESDAETGNVSGEIGTGTDGTQQIADTLTFSAGVMATTTPEQRKELQRKYKSMRAEADWRIESGEVSYVGYIETVSIDTRDEIEAFLNDRTDGYYKHSEKAIHLSLELLFSNLTMEENSSTVMYSDGLVVRPANPFMVFAHELGHSQQKTLGQPYDEVGASLYANRFVPFLFHNDWRFYYP